jgi:hypothetical protein
MLPSACSFIVDGLTFSCKQNLEHLGHSPKQSMHTGDAEAIETVNEKHTTANL